jgi:hypothetical protein
VTQESPFVAPSCRFCGTQLLFRGQTTCQHCGESQTDGRGIDRAGTPSQDAPPSASTSPAATTSVPAPAAAPGQTTPVAAPASPIFEDPAAAHASWSNPPESTEDHDAKAILAQFGLVKSVKPAAPSPAAAPAPAASPNPAPSAVPAMPVVDAYAHESWADPAISTEDRDANALLAQYFGRADAVDPAIGAAAGGEVAPRTDAAEKPHRPVYVSDRPWDSWDWKTVLGVVRLLALVIVLIIGSLLKANSHNNGFAPDGSVVFVPGYQSRTDAPASQPIAEPSCAVSSAPGSFCAAGLMADARERPTATLLQDGRVLVAGGTNLGRPLDTAELFDPKTGTFSATGSMVSARWGHTATLLRDGRVFIAGGEDQEGVPLATTEIFDPRTGLFKATALMSSARYEHTANLMPDGTVLIVGGFAGANDTNPRKSADSYNATTGKFRTAAAMTTARGSHTATTLADGSIFIAGGSNDGPNPLATTEVYDAKTRGFKPGPTMLSARVGHTATLLGSGGVLIAGGSDGSTVLASTEICVPDIGACALSAALNTARTDQTATRLGDGRVLICGGIDGVARGHFPPEFYDPVAGQIAGAGLLPGTPPWQTVVLLADGRVLLVGGTDENGAASNSADIYEP